jgi:hypothetical protein
MEVGRALYPRCAGAAALTLLLVAGNAAAQDETTSVPQTAPAEDGPPPTPPVVATPPVATPPVVATPPAPHGPRFGDAGVFVVSADSSIGIASTEFSQTAARRFSVGFSPGFDYFVIRRFSIGVDVSLAYSNGRGYGADSSLVETTVTTFAGGARFGLELPLGDAVSFYPRVTLGVESVHRESHVLGGSPLSVNGSGSLSVTSNPIGTPSETLQGPYASAFAPLLFHPARHFFLGAGPSLFHEFGKAQAAASVGGERTTIQARVVVGGWWGGDDAADASAASADATALAPPTPTARRPRFGDANEWVLSGELGAGVARTTYGGVDSSVTSFNVSPSFDYFAAAHVSLGLGGTVGHTFAESPRADGPKVQEDQTTLALVGRVGLDLPLSPALSLYPRASLAVGRTSYDARSGIDQNKYSVINVTAGLFAPLLVHVAPHAFVGLGPFVSHDLSNKAEDRLSNNLATTVGGRLIVGGWLSR